MNKQNPFKKLNQHKEEVPKELRQKVMGNVSKAKLLMDIAGIFTDALPSSISNLFKSNKKR